MHQFQRLVLSASLCALLSAGTLSCEKSTGDTASPEDAGASVTAQIKEGSGLYREHCGGCHGPAGKGTEGTPALIGADALPEAPAPSAKTRTGNFTTAADLVGYVSENMPPGDGGSLADDEYYAIVAWVLNVNGWRRESVLDEASAASVQLGR